MSCPGSYPTVLNGQMSTSDNNTAEYECLSGFSMSGLKRITCSSGVWQSAPTCSVIRQYDEYTTFPDWWLFVLAIILGLMLLACFLCLCLYFCCCRGRPHGSGCCDGGPCSCCRRGRRTRAWEEDVDGRYHVIRVSPQPHDHGNSDGVYFVPVSETRSDGDLTERPPKAKKPAKEVRAWLPHANPVRNINTSTK